MPALADSALIATSFFNTIVLLWLGLTLLLNADRRRWGTWVVGSGMLLAGLFFGAHSAVIGRAADPFGPDLAIWWSLGWLPFLIAPYLWYLSMAWYTGVLARQRRWCALISVIGILAAALLVLGHPLPTYDQLVQHRPGVLLGIAGIPVVLLIYPIYSLLCIVLALDRKSTR